MQLWKKCCEKLQSLRLDPVEGQPHAGKFEEDLRAGYIYREAIYLQKTRDRAAKHQAQLAQMPGLGIDDLPRSWGEEAEGERKLKLGFIKEKQAKKAQKKMQKAMARGQHTASYRIFSVSRFAPSSWGSRAGISQPVTPNKAVTPQPKTPDMPPPGQVTSAAAPAPTYANQASSVAAPATTYAWPDKEDEKNWGGWKPRWTEEEWAEWRANY